MRAWYAIILVLVVGACGGGSGGGEDPAAPPELTGDVLFYPFTGAKQVLFVIVEFQDAPALFTNNAAGEGEVRSIRDDVIDAFDRSSYGRLALGIDYTWPPLLIQKSTTDYDPRTGLVNVRADALEVARAAGYAVDAYDREVLFSPRVWGGPAGRGWVRTVWMPHKLRWVAVHELGHTLGRGHANFWDGDPVGMGSSVEYGDIYDPMGSGQQWNRYRHSGPWFKLRADWLPQQDVLTVTAPGTYTLTSLEDPDVSVGPTALRIRRDPNHDYWIFYRSTEELVDEGPVIVKTGTNPFDGTLLLDMNPASVGSEVADAALAFGQIFDDSAAAGITVQNVGLGTDSVTLEIDVDEPRQLALDTPPTVDVVSPTRDLGPVQGVVEFEIQVYDTDVGRTDGAGIDRVTLSILVPDQDPFSVIATTELLAPPYAWSYDTDDGSLLDAPHYLSVTAAAADGGETTVWFRFLVANEVETP